MKRALAISALLLGCGARPPALSPEQASSALCAVDAVRRSGDPRQLSPEQSVQLALALAGCFPSSADAGAQ